MLAKHSRGMFCNAFIRPHAASRQRASGGRSTSRGSQNEFTYAGWGCSHAGLVTEEAMPTSLGFRAVHLHADIGGLQVGRQAVLDDLGHQQRVRLVAHLVQEMIKAQV